MKLEQILSSVASSAIVGGITFYGAAIVAAMVSISVTSMVCAFAVGFLAASINFLRDWKCYNAANEYLNKTNQEIRNIPAPRKKSFRQGLRSSGNPLEMAKSWHPYREASAYSKDYYAGLTIASDLRHYKITNPARAALLEDLVKKVSPRPL